MDISRAQGKTNVSGTGAGCDGGGGYAQWWVSGVVFLYGELYEVDADLYGEL